MTTPTTGRPVTVTLDIAQGKAILVRLQGLCVTEAERLLNSEDQTDNLRGLLWLWLARRRMDAAEAVELVGLIAPEEVRSAVLGVVEPGV